MSKQMNSSIDPGRSGALSASKCVPQLRFPEFEGEWEKKKLGEVFSIFNGYAFASNESVENGTLWVKIADVGIQEMKKDNLSFLPLEFKEKHSKFLLKKGDYVVALTRPILSGKLKIACIDNFFDNSLLNQRVGKIETKNSNSFIYCYLQKDELIKSIENNIAGSDPPNLSPSEINSIELVLPTLPEQTKIATFLTAVDEKLNALKKKKAHLDVYKKGVMQKLFPSTGSGQSQEVRFKITNEKGEIVEPPDWEVKRLGEVYCFLVTNSFSRENLNYETGSVKNIHYGDIHTKYSTLFNISKEDVPYINQEINLSRISNENYCKEGDVIFADASEDLNDVGKSIEIIKLNGEKVLSGLHTLLARPVHSNLSIGFGGYLFKSENIRLQIQKEAQGSKVLSISASRLSNIEISIPCLEEQTKIANFLSAIDEKINHTQSQIEKTEVWKKGLLQKMFV